MIDLEAIKRKVDALNGKQNFSNNVKLWKPAEGEHTIRVLPWKESMLKDGMPFIERYVYFGIAGRKPIVSPRSFGKPDPIDAFVGKLYDEARNGKPESKALANKIRAKLFTCAAIIDRNAEDDGPMLWSMNGMITKDVMSFFLNKKIGDFTHPTTGRDFTVTVSPSPKKFNERTVFDVKIMPSLDGQTPISDDPEKVKKWMDSLPNVDDFYKPQSYEEIKVLFDTWLNSGGPDSVIGGSTPSAPTPTLHVAPATLTVVNATEAAAKEKKPVTKPRKAEDIENSIDNMLKDLDDSEE